MIKRSGAIFGICHSQNHGLQSESPESTLGLTHIFAARWPAKVHFLRKKIQNKM